MRSYFARTFTALESPQYRVLWFGTLFSFLGMQMQIIARGYLAFDLTGKNSALGGVMLAFGLPSLLLTLWGGVIADRLPKRRTIVVTQGVIAINAGWMATMIATGLVQFWMLLVAGLVQGVAFSFMGPARQAFVSDLVGRDRIGNAVVLQQLSMNGTRVIGPSIAGVFISIQFIGLAGTYLMTTLGFIIAMVMTMRLPAGEPAPRDDARSAAGDLLDGLRYVRSRPSIAILLLTSLVMTSLAFPFQAFLPSIAVDIYDAGSRGLGALSSVQAVGAVVATVIIASVAGHPRAWHIQPVLAAGFGASIVLLGAMPSFVTGLVAISVVGAFSAGFQSLNNSLSLTLSDSAYHGRVQSLNMLAWSLFGLAAMPLGVVADLIGIQEMLMLTGGLSVVCVLGLRFLSRVWGAEEDRRAAFHEPPDFLAEPAGGR
ncbi:MAG: MFS transporter [Dehalococcoidia bacterium]